MLTHCVSITASQASCTRSSAFRSSLCRAGNDAPVDRRCRGNLTGIIRNHGHDRGDKQERDEDSAGDSKERMCSHGTGQERSIPCRGPLNLTIARSMPSRSVFARGSGGASSVCAIFSCSHFHLMLQPMLGFWSAMMSAPASRRSRAARRSEPVTGRPLPGVESSRRPR